MHRTDNHPLVTLALRVAVTAHAGQFRADGKTPYICHPEDVERRFIDYGRAASIGDEVMATGRAIALMHDVVEDTDVSFDHVVAYGLASIVPQLKFLTKTPEVSYLDYILRIRDQPDDLVLAIKLLDMESNLNDLDSLPSKGRAKAMRTKYELARYILLHTATRLDTSY